MYDNSSKVIEVDIDEILPNRFQPRIQFDEEEILELSDSIKEHGVIQPLVVRTVGDKYEIIAGERRYKASVLAGKETVPVIVKNLNDKDSAEVALIENIQRKNLTPIEEALSYKKILDMGYITQENLASKLGKSQSAVANKVRLLNLSDEVQEALLENKISERHARSLLKLTSATQQTQMLNRIINERLTVRRTDEEIEKLKNNSTEDETEGTEKIIEKGEIDMNNNMFGMPNVPENPQLTSTFDIFGTTNQQPTPIVEPTPVTPVDNQNVPQNFDIFGGAPVAPAPAVEQQPMMPEFPQAPVMPTMDVQMPQASVVEQQPMMAEFPQAPVMPTMDVQMPQAPAVEQQPMMPEFPQAPVIPEIPQTAPIIETPVVENNQMTQQSENLFSFGDMSETVETPNSNEVQFKMPEPIIITDFSKQYDPVMPPSPEDVVSTLDFKEVIAAIRECSSRIENYGFKLDVEEYDLANIYQVIFKIEK